MHVSLLGGQRDGNEVQKLVKQSERHSGREGGCTREPESRKLKQT
jgi:hypothetical protein